MNETSDAGVRQAATVCLAAALGCVVLFLPPLLDGTIATPLRAAATGAALGCTLLLHWIFLGLAARRQQRSVPVWVGLSVLLFPIGSVLSLVLLGWFADERRRLDGGSRRRGPVSPAARSRA